MGSLFPEHIQTNMSAWLVLLLVNLAVIILVPYTAWKGRPRGFKRLNWMGVTAGATLVGLILLFLGFIAIDSWQMTALGLSLLAGAATVLAVGIGSLVAVFFCRPSNG